jgi:protease I
LTNQEEGTMAGALDGKRIAVLAAEGVEQVELVEPRKQLENAGAVTELISISGKPVQAMNHIDKGDTFPVDHIVDQVEPGWYDALFVPGGVLNPDNLRMDQRAVRFVRSFYDTGKPIAAICHAPWVLVEADVVRDLEVTSWPSLQTDIRNAGGTWVDREVVVDRGIVTSRKPDDIPAFTGKMIEEFGEGRHERQQRMAGQSTAG